MQYNFSNFKTELNKVAEFLSKEEEDHNVIQEENDYNFD